MKRSDAATTLERGDRFSPFQLASFPYGQRVGYRPGRVTVLSFCALWCVTWKEQAARLRRVEDALEGLPIDYLTISVDGRWAEQFHGAVRVEQSRASDRSATGNSSGIVLLDVGGTVSARAGVTAVPYIFIVDRQGMVLYAHQGIVRTEELVGILRNVTTSGGAVAVADRRVFLTFDDFPAFDPTHREMPSDDEQLLDILRSEKVRSTLFCIASHLEAPVAAAVASRAVSDGHSLQIHSWAHNAADPQLERCRRAIVALVRNAPSPTLYRPPGCSEILRLDLSPERPVRAVVNPYDFTRPGAAELARRVLQAIRPGGVIQLHAGVEQTRDALPAMISSMRRQSLEFDLMR